MNTQPPWEDSLPVQTRFPSLQGQQETDVVVIGAGIVGVTIAHLLKKEGKRVIVLEKNRVASGSTGASTGFLSCVPDTSIDALVKKYGVSFVTNLFAETRRSQKTFFQSLEPLASQIEFTQCKTHILPSQDTDPILVQEWEAIHKTCPQATFESDQIKIPDEGKFHPRKYLVELAKQISIFEESEVERLELDPDICVYTQNGSVKAKQLVMATSDPRSLFPEFAHLIEERLSFVLLASYAQLPLGKEIAWDTNSPYFYWRSWRNSIMLGGCDQVPGIKPQQPPQEILTSFLESRFGKPETITHFWSGSLFETKDGLPFAFAYPSRTHNLFFVTGLGGNGLVYGNWCAEIVRDLVMGRKNKGEELLHPQRLGLPLPPLKREKHEQIMTKKFVSFGNVNEFQNFRPIAKEIEGCTIMVTKFQDRFFAADNRCTHAGGSLCDGELKEKIITCPLHGAKFDVTTGEVKGPPAIRSLRNYATRVVNGMLEVEIQTNNTAPSPEKFKDPFVRFRLLFFVSVAVFWILEIFYQRYTLPKADLSYHLLAASAFTGATLISLALCTSAIFKWIPRFADWWRLRRYLGVSGVIFVCVHVGLVWATILEWDFKRFTYSYNPFENPMLFGSLAFPIFLAMALTSTDWAVEKLSFKRWKRIHRLVYIAFPLMMLHYVGMRPDLWTIAPGILLGVTSALALFGQLYWFVETTIQQGIKRSTFFGLLLIFLFAYLAFLAFNVW